MIQNEYFNVKATSGNYNSINIVEYISDDTYIPPSNLLYARVICVGAGGGGGAGRGSAGQMLGSSGGGGGSLASLVLTKNEIGSSQTITIGQGGLGGSTIIVNGGADGISGGTTSFGSLVVAVGGEGGNGAFINPLPAPVNGGNRTLNTPKYFPNSISGGISGRGSSNGNAVATSTLNIGGYSSAGVGGGGGGGHTAALNNSNGGAGGAVMDKNGTVYTRPGAAGTTGADGSNGINDISLFEAEDGQISTIGIGNGGSGGGNGTDNINDGGRGGNGGRGSGGGGAGSFKSGVVPDSAIAGGNGGNGFCIIVEYLS